MRRFKTGTVEKIREIAVFITLAVFVIAQAVMLILASVGVVNQVTFQFVLLITASILMVVWNVSATVIYFENTGSPYISKDHWRRMRKLIIVIVVWNVTFVIKFIATFFGQQLATGGLITKPDAGFWGAIYVATFVIITEVLPLFMVIDGSFVKIFSGEAIEESHASQSLLFVSEQ